MLQLWDIKQMAKVCDLETAEEGVEFFGELMTYKGQEWVTNRFMVVEEPDKHGQAKIVYQPPELFQRGLVYFDPDIAYTNDLWRKGLI